MKRTLIVVLGALGAQVASAGVYVELVDHDIKSGKTELAQKMYVQEGAGRFVDPEGRVTLIKGGTLYIIDETDKSYVRWTRPRWSCWPRSLPRRWSRSKSSSPSCRRISARRWNR